MTRAFSRLRLLATIAVATVTACSSDPTAGLSGNLDTVTVDPTEDTGGTVKTDVVSKPDTNDPLAGQDTDQADADTTVEPDVAETVVDCTATPGAAGCPCANSNSCDSSWCVLTRDGERCADYCTEACPEGYECRTVTAPGAGADVSTICVDRLVSLCKPCAANTDCAALGFEGQNKCVNYGDAGSFCGVGCEASTDCPEGYECNAEKQCVAVSGLCSCAPLHQELEAETECLVTNQFGSCKGARKCSAAGLTECDADTPEAEKCDGVDNDCSGAKDDIPPTTCPIANAYGTCQGQLLCQGGIGICQGNPATSEVCDGQDNDCDGVVDEGYPNNDSDDIGDCVDPDDDNDGILDEADNCDITPNSDQVDTNGDGEGDTCDPDDDGDGSPDSQDCKPLISVVFPFAEEKCDGIDNDCDGATDEKSCSDDNPCTDDVCNPTSGCDHPYNNLPCSDGNTCTDKDICAFGQCGGNFVVCDDGNPCTTDSCLNGQGCSNAPNILACTDGNACTKADACSGGQCVPGSLLDCSDDNPCTITSCSPTSGCTSAPIDNPCNDNNACTTNDKCVGTGCNGTASNCDDGNPCTVDSCTSGSGCTHAPTSGQTCNDGIICTTGDTCSNGVCQGNDSGCTCLSTPDCAVSEDGNACNGVLLCDTTSAPFKCRINPASVVSCSLPAGLSPDCATVACDPASGSCTTTLTVDGTNCNDGDGCTESDVCQAGVCGGSKKVCNDGNLCTLDACDKTLGCVFSAVPGVKSCDDNNACTANDLCETGFCIGKTVVACNDSNPCTNDSCNPTSGCAYANNAQPCSDFSSCTTGDQCLNGSCKPGIAVACDDGDKCNGTESCNSTQGCLPGPALVCNDGLACTTDSCSAAQGCLYLPSDTACSDGQFCNGAETCVVGQGCKSQNLTDGTTCNDGNACTKNDQCIAGSCIGAGLQCDDGNPCTTDACDATGAGCTHTAVAQFAKCDDKNACTTTDVCDAGFCVGTGTLDCSDGKVCTDDTCLPSVGCNHANNTATCNDGDACTTGDICGGGACAGKVLDCSTVGDGDSCTENDVCVLGACVGTPLDCSTLNDQCNSGVCQGGFCYAKPVTKSCSDGNPCTTADACSAGSCVGIPVDCTGLDTPCAKGICQDGICSAQTLACKATRTIIGFTSASLQMTPLAGHKTRGALGQGNTTGKAKNATGLQVRIGFPGGL